MTKNCKLMLGYDLDIWNQFGEAEPIEINISENVASHIILAGATDSGKTYMQKSIMARFFLASEDCEIYFADYKREDSHSYLRECSHYFSYKDAGKTLDMVYDIMQRRISGEDKTRHKVVLVFEEYVAYILSLQTEDKKKAQNVIKKMSELLMLSRGSNIAIMTVCQRPDAEVYQAGARTNYTAIIVLGGASKSVYEMLMPDHVDKIKDRIFRQGEGVLLLHNSVLRFIKSPTVRDENKLQDILLKGLGRPLQDSGGVAKQTPPLK